MFKKISFCLFLFCQVTYAGTFRHNGNGVFAGSLTATSFAGQINVYQNKINNGRFDFWQRNTTFAAAASTRYTADRWLSVGTGTTIAVDRTAHTVGQTTVPGEPRFYASVSSVTSAGSGNRAVFNINIEDVRNCNGRACTLSFWARADSTKTIGVGYVQIFGTGGSPSAGTSGNVGTYALTTSFQKFTTTFTLPSISGKTLGTTENTSYIALEFYLDCGSAFNSRCGTIGQQSMTLSLSDVSLVEGSYSPELYQYAGGNYVGELLIAQRYYEKSYDLTTIPAAATAVGQVTNQCRMANTTTADHCSTIMYKSQKRVIPSVSLWDNLGATNVWKDPDNNSIATTLENQYTGGFSVGTTATSGRTAAQAFSFTGHFIADADF